VIGIAWVLVLVLGLVPPLLREANTDISWPIYLASRILEGARQGIDFLEVNPPLFLWLAIPPVLVERATGISAWHVNVLMVAAIAACSLLLTSHLLPELVPERRRRAWLLLAAGFAALVLPRVHYGQREHLAFLLTLPFATLAALRLRDAPVPPAIALAVGVVGGAGFAIKPHFLLAWLLLELLLLTRRGRAALRRPELISLVSLGAAYLLAVVVFVPDYLPMAVRLGRWYDMYINNGVANTVLLADPLTLFALLALLALRISTPNEDALTTTLTTAFFGFLAAAILQRKGFSYHFVAAACYGLVAVVRGWHVLPRGAGVRPSLLMARASVVLILAFVARSTFDAGRELSNPHDRRYRTDPSYPELLPVVKELALGEPIVVFSSNPAAGWPLTLDAGARWASRYMSFWPMPAIYDRQLWGAHSGLVEFHSPAQQSEFERGFIGEVAEDIERWKPRLIIVLRPDSTARQWGGAYRFDYLEYFRSSEKFERLLRDFRPGPSVGRYAIWIRHAG
jgi:hypothetical protein